MQMRLFKIVSADQKKEPDAMIIAILIPDFMSGFLFHRSDGRLGC